MSEQVIPTLLQLIEGEGYKVVKAKRLEALERLYADMKNWRYGLIDKAFDRKGSLVAAYPAIYRLANTFDEIEWAFKVEALGDKQ